MGRAAEETSGTASPSAPAHHARRLLRAGGAQDRIAQSGKGKRAHTARVARTSTAVVQACEPLTWGWATAQALLAVRV